MKKCKKCGEFKYSREFHYANKERGWRQGTCKECQKEISKISMRKYLNKNRQEMYEKRKKWGEENKEYVKERNKYWKIKYREDALKAYSGGKPKCACCGEDEIKFLCIDHENNDGNSHRKKIGSNIYSWLKQNNYPKGFQVLCFNCNNAKQMHGECPHQELII